MKSIRIKPLVLLGCIGAVCLVAFIACDMVHFFETVVVSDPNDTVNPPPPPPPPPGGSEQTIRDAFAQITPVTDPTDDNEIYDIVPDWLTDPTSPVIGDLSDTYEANGLDTLNFLRSLAGLSPVTIDASLIDQAQAGADVLAISKVFAHAQDYDVASANIWLDTGTALDLSFHSLGNTSTTSSNLFMSSGMPTLAVSVMAYLDDSDTSNIAVVGHRRWCINPQMSKTAFGRAFSDNGHSYMTMQSFDTGGSPASDYVAWPSPANEGKFPAEAFGSDQAWSVSLPASAYDTSVPASDITVVLANSSSDWTFTVADTNTSGKYFNVDVNPVGIPYCIIFRPDGSPPLVGETYSVEITGIKDSGGSPTTITYDIEFFSLSSP